jgi:hypothetical protein
LRHGEPCARSQYRSRGPSPHQRRSMLSAISAYRTSAVIFAFGDEAASAPNDEAGATSFSDSQHDVDVGRRQRLRVPRTWPHYTGTPAGSTT